MINSGDLMTGARLGFTVWTVSGNDAYRLVLKENFLKIKNVICRKLIDASY